jgi:hypothetical protein
VSEVNKSWHKKFVEETRAAKVRTFTARTPAMLVWTLVRCKSRPTLTKMTLKGVTTPKQTRPICFEL